MAKDYSNGYTQGQEDGKDGDNKLAMRSFKRLLNIGTWLPGAENRDAQFRTGYLAGFEDKVRIRQTITPEENAMPDTQGRSDYLDKDSYVEHHARRPTENWLGVSDAVQATTQTTLAGGSMSDLSFAQQVQLLEALKKSLMEFQNTLQQSAGQYEQAVQYLGSRMLHETFERYSAQELAATKQQVRALVDHISAHDLTKIQAEINYLLPKV